MATKQEAMKIKYGTSSKVLSMPIVNKQLYVIHGVKCFCAACSKLQDIPEERKLNGQTRWESGYAECGDCGNVGQLKTVQEDRRGASVILNPKNNSASFFVPKQCDVFISKGDDGKITKMSSSVVMDHIMVYESGKHFVKQERLVQDYSVVDHQMRQVQVARGAGGKDETVGIVRNSNRFSINKTANAALEGLSKFDDRGQLFQVDYAPTALPLSPVYEGNGQGGYDERIGRARFLWESMDIDGRVREVMYKAVAEEYGLPAPEDASSSFMVHTVEFATLYPAVMQYEMDKLNENMEFTNQRREAAGEPLITEEEKIKMRASRLVQVETSVALMDNKLSSDLSRMQTPEQVKSYLKVIAFGGTPEVPLPADVKVKPSEAVNDGFSGKKLRTRFNINPYATASNVRTALKLGFGDPNYLNALFEIADVDMSPKEAQRNRNQPAIGGVLRPIESQNELRFAKLVVQGRGPAQALKDIYGSTGNMGSFLDSAGMYADVVKGKIAVTEEELNAERVLSAMKQVVRQFHSRGDDIEAVCQNETFVRSWGDDTRSMVEFMLGKQKEYDDRGVEPESYVATTDGRPLFKNRNMNEVHEELVTMMSKYKSASEATNFYFDWTKEQKEKANKTIGEYSFHLADSSNELIRVGQQMHICVGGKNYDDDCRRGRMAIVFMEDKDGNYVGCIETDSDLRQVRQFKSPHNGAICGEDKVAAAKQWMEEAKMRGCRDTEHFGDEHYYPYGRGNFDVHRALLAERVVQLPKIGDCMKAFKFLEAQREHEAEKAKSRAETVPSMAD